MFLHIGRAVGGERKRIGQQIRENKCIQPIFTPYPIQGVPPIDSNYPVNELAREEGHCIDERKSASQSVSCPGLR